ncbi:hydroxyacid dehydrogenase, partial [Candidatus Roizmanbacteria bacterium CG11_big_fil_rev_8_21_14_0_20_36_8]
LSKSILKNFPKLKHIATRSTGFDHIDTEYCSKRKITVSNVPEYGSNTVAEHTFALILSLTRKIYQSVSQAKRLNFNHKEIRGVDLHGKTLGIIGMGKIGVNVLRIAHGFGMNLIVNTRSRNDELREKYDFKYVDLDELLRSSDVISLHLPLFPETKHIINMDNLSLIKNGCYLINTARGGLVDTRTLIEGLNNNTFAGVALDVLEEEKELTEEAAILTQHFQKDANMETLVMDHYLINHPKVLITPHNAFNSIEALARIENTTIENIKAFLEGKDINLVTSHS